MIQTAPCRFCGQVVQIQDALTDEEAVEAATMACECQEAVSYRENEERKERAMQNVRILFGREEDSDRVTQILLSAVEGIGSGRVVKITLNLHDGTKAVLSRNGTGGIDVERTETRKRRLTG